ncbi:MAG: hypothetical protein L0207_00020 [Chlamydiae bacterium]|nr:hypothetical protein [Chlamydiota bacterium]
MATQSIVTKVGGTIILPTYVDENNNNVGSTIKSVGVSTLLPNLDKPVKDLSLRDINDNSDSETTKRIKGLIAKGFKGSGVISSVTPRSSVIIEKKDSREEERKVRFADLKAHILEEKKLKLDDVKQFFIYPELATCTYIDVSSNREIELNLHDFENPKLKEAIKEYLDLVRKIYKFPLATYPKYGKGDIYGPKALIKPKAVQNSVLNSFLGWAKHSSDMLNSIFINDEEASKIFIKRFAHAKSVHEALTLETEEALSQTKTEIEDPQTKQDPKKLKKVNQEHMKLLAFQKELKELDVFALVFALAYDSLNDTQEEKTEALFHIMNEIFNFTKPKRKDIDQVKLEKEYTCDVVGMMLPRKAYDDWCKKNNIKLKKPSLEDLFFKEAIQVSNQPDLPVKGGLNERFDIFSEEIKTRLENALKPNLISD